jgi:N-acyl-D-amino-acid deacylase
MATGDVRIGDDGTVAASAPSLAPLPDEAVVEGDGLVLAPGFVDMHSHSDLWTLVREGPGAPLGDGPKLLQGCTTQVFGQDGISAAPVRDDDVDGYAAYIAGLDGYLDPAQWTWRTFEQYLAELRRRSSTRVAGLVGHATVRRLVMGMDARPPTADELAAMQDAVDLAMRSGAIGMSTGLVYAPASFADTEELVALNEVVARHGGRFFVHVRSESDRVVEATHEVLEVARRTGVHLHYSHIKTAGRANWPLADRLLEMITDYQSGGVKVTCDVHPYTAGSTTATVLLPPWAMEGGREAAIQRLRTPEDRVRMRDQIVSDTTSWDNWWAFSGGWEGLRIADASRRSLVGESFTALLDGADGRSQEAFDRVFDFLADEGLAVSLVSFNNVEENVATFLSQPYATVGSDALVNPTGHPHPRLYGTFPRVLGRFVRDLGALSLEDAVTAMTGRAAAALGLGGSAGRIAEGGPADLVLFDPARIIDRATYEEPRLRPEGIERVWVGGRPVALQGELAEEIPAAG